MSDIEVVDRSAIVRREVDRESTERALAVMDPSVLDTMFASREPKAIVQRIADVSTVLMDAVHQRDLARRYGDNQNEFLHIEAWEFLSSMLGMTTVGVDSRALPDGSGWEATAELRHVASGRVLGRRDGMCQKTEPAFARRRGGPPPDNTIRQMAQIRAARAAARSVLGFVPKIGGFEITDPDAPATKEQIGLLHQLERSLGWSHAKGHQEANVESYKELTREQAGEIIELWNAEIEEMRGDTPVSVGGAARPSEDPDGEKTDGKEVGPNGAAQSSEQAAGSQAQGDPHPPIPGDPAALASSEQWARAFRLFKNDREVLRAHAVRFGKSVKASEITAGELAELLEAKTKGEADG